MYDSITIRCYDYHVVEILPINTPALKRNETRNFIRVGHQQHWQRRGR